MRAPPPQLLGTTEPAFPRAQSSLSDSVSYCADSSGAGSRSQSRFCGCGAAWAADAGAHAMGVGGVLLSIRMVRGLYGN